MQRASSIAFVSLLLLACSTGLIGLGKLGGASNVILLTATVSVSPSSTTIPANQNFTIGVNVSGVSDLYGWEFQLGWNSTLLDAANVSEGPFLKAGGSTFFSYSLNATAGNMLVDCTLMGNIPGTSGDGTLATITFYAKSVGECPLDLHDVILLNSAEQPIPSQAVGGYGYFTSSQLHDVAVAKVTASPIAALPGDTIKVNVTVQNEGSFAEVFNVTVYANSQIIGMRSVSLGSGSSTIITFAWNTTGFGKGDYTVLASASVVPGEANIANNNKQADNPVTLLYNGHDIAVITVGSSKTVVGQGYSTSITIIVKDYGVFSETFNTTVYANTTAIYMQTVSLQSAASATLSFNWDTSSFMKSNYTLSAYAWPVLGETGVANNNFTGGVVTISIPGDVNGDLTVDIYDALSLAGAFNVIPKSSSWNPNADINNDNTVDIYDAIILASNYGKTA